MHMQAAVCSIAQTLNAAQLSGLVVAAAQVFVVAALASMSASHSVEQGGGGVIGAPALSPTAVGERDGKEAGGGGDYGRGGVEVVLALALRKCGASGVDVDVVSCSVSPFRVSHSCSACVWAREGAREFVCSCSLKRDWLVGRIALVDRVSERACTCEREKQRLSDYPALLSFAGS